MINVLNQIVEKKSKVEESHSYHFEFAFQLPIMADGERMPKFDPAKDSNKLSYVEKEFVKRYEDYNLTRVKEFKKKQVRGRWTAGFLTLGVLSIYSYTIWAIKQENFLDDFDEPEKISDSQ
ncbi:hypothetical protein QAD02_019459 [Eretmocerus hayati]|uniref:Uncharacterized protein n=1 Tax=Eretmocerus hayati TaxID=131215 RepID=A0ACC2PMT5_9HYME|nr:hypothetical protein QAD02_019459 [Eretmocerus hayati]